VGGFSSALCLEVIDRPLIFVACFAQLLEMLLGDVLLILRTSFKQLKPGSPVIRRLEEALSTQM
jgi:hypothetical protein